MNRVENDDLSLLEKLFHGPLTRTGWWAVGLAVGFLALFAVMCSWPSRLAAEGQQLRTFWAYPPYSLVVISTGIVGSAAGLVSGIGIAVKRERSLLLFLILVIGAFVLIFSAAEPCEGLR